MYPSNTFESRSCTIGNPPNSVSERILSTSSNFNPTLGNNTKSRIITAETGTPKECSSFLSKNGNPLNQIILIVKTVSWTRGGERYRSAMPAFPNQSPTIFVTPTTIIVGRIYRTPPVNSNMITTTLTVMCIIPPRAAAAPRNA